jgi:hypothetical protein
VVPDRSPPCEERKEEKDLLVEIVLPVKSEK